MWAGYGIAAVPDGEARASYGWGTLDCQEDGGVVFSPCVRGDMGTPAKEDTGVWGWGYALAMLGVTDENWSCPWW